MLSKRLQAISDSVNRLDGERDSLVKSIESFVESIAECDSNISTLETDLKVLGTSMEILKEFISILSTYGLSQYTELINRGLKTIFVDRNYEFKIEIDNRGRTKKATMLSRREIDGEWCDWRNIDHANGGTLRAIIDLITRVYLISSMGRRRFIVFDESLSQMSEEYVPNVISFLEVLSKEMGFDILFLSQDPRYIGHANRAYKMSWGNAVLLETEASNG